MKLSWANEGKGTIRVELEEGEQLGNWTGPVTAFVPVADDNTDYAAIVRDQIEIEPFTP